MKYITTLLLTILFSQITLGQDSYENFVQALISGDTILAAKIEKDNAYIIENSIIEKQFLARNNSEYIFHLGINQLKDTIVALFNFENQYNNKFLSPIFYDYMSENDTSQENKLSISFNAETSNNSLFGRDYFSKKNTVRRYLCP